MENDQEKLILMLDVDQFEHLLFLRGQESRGLGWSETGEEPSNQVYVEQTVKLQDLIGKDVAIQSAEVFGSWVIQGTHQQIQEVKTKIAGSIFIVGPDNLEEMESET